MKDLIQDAFTFGVEEEFLLADPDTRLVVPKAAEVIAGIPSDLRDYVKYELLLSQIEICTPICSTMGELRDALVRLRAAAARAAERAGCRLLPAGTGLLDVATPPAVTDTGRFAQQAYNLGALIDLPGLCALHVHVAVRDRDMAAAVSNHLRPWLSVLQAVSTNSPFAIGRDTTYASWRSMLAMRYPTSGPPPWLNSAAHHDEIVRDLISSGAMSDNRGLYWYTRPSPVYPTIEVRVGDVCSTVDESIFIAGLARALVLNAVSLVDNGHQGPAVENPLLVAAYWRSARFGLDGDATDVVNATTRPGYDLLDGLITSVAPVLKELGDFDTILGLRDGIQDKGTGAQRQRAVFAEHRDLRAVVDYLSTQATASQESVSRAYEQAGV